MSAGRRLFPKASPDLVSTVARLVGEESRQLLTVDLVGAGHVDQAYGRT